MMRYEKLIVYQVSIEFLGLSFKIIEQLPRGYSELADQLKRASMRIPLNIAEGGPANVQRPIAANILISLVAVPWSVAPFSMFAPSCHWQKVSPSPRESNSLSEWWQC
jgi:hypothetical protein